MTRCQRRGQNRGPEGPKIKALNSVKTLVVNGKIMYEDTKKSKIYTKSGLHVCKTMIFPVVRRW